MCHFLYDHIFPDYEYPAQGMKVEYQEKNYRIFLPAYVSRREKTS